MITNIETKLIGKKIYQKVYIRFLIKETNKACLYLLKVQIINNSVTKAGSEVWIPKYVINGGNLNITDKYIYVEEQFVIRMVFV